MKLYPFDLPDGVHPLAWTLLGHGLDVKGVNALARQLYDGLGVRFVERTEPVDVSFEWGVNWVLEKAGREHVNVGDSLDMLVPGGDVTAVRIVDGHLPPGIKLQKHTGRLVGTFREPGVYRVTLRVGTALKYDPLGGDGSPQSVGMFIPVEQPRMEVPSALGDIAAPVSVADLSDAEKQELLAELLADQNMQTAREADGGN